MAYYKTTGGVTDNPDWAALQGYQMLSGPMNTAQDAYNWTPQQSTAPTGGTSAPSGFDANSAQSGYNQNITQLLAGLKDTYGYSAANQNVADAIKARNDFQYRDLTKVFSDYANSLGLSGLSQQIADLTGQANKQKRVLEDLPETIQELYRDTGATTAQQGRVEAVNSRPIIRNISDLLNSVSILSDQYNRGSQQAQYLTGLAGQQDTQRYGQLSDMYGMASDQLGNVNSQIGALFPTLAGGITTPYQQESMFNQRLSDEAQRAYQQQTLAQDESQFARSLAEEQRQFNNPRYKGSGDGETLGTGDTAQYDLGADVNEAANIVRKAISSGKLNYDSPVENQAAYQEVIGYLKSRHPKTSLAVLRSQVNSLIWSKTSAKKPAPLKSQPSALNNYYNQKSSSAPSIFSRDYWGF